MIMVTKRLLRYLPKASRDYVVFLDFDRDSHVYFLTFGNSEGNEVSAEPSDTVSELAWNAKSAWKHFLNNDFD